VSWEFVHTQKSEQEYEKEDNKDETEEDGCGGGCHIAGGGISGWNSGSRC
jgi:hypothetical protein